MLALDGHKIIQVLEGPEWQVELLFAKIAVDQRHMGVVELDRLEINQHRYAQWGMVRRLMSDILMSLPAG